MRDNEARLLVLVVGCWRGVNEGFGVGVGLESFCAGRLVVVVLVAGFFKMLLVGFLAGILRTLSSAFLISLSRVFLELFR